MVQLVRHSAEALARIRGGVAVLACCLILAASAPAAAAADPAQARATFDEGRRLFQAGEYREALASFKKGFLNSEDAAFLLNIARCHRLLGEPKEALMMYRLYLKSAPVGENPEARTLATTAIRELEGETAAAGPAAPAATETPTAAPTTPTPPVPSIRTTGRDRGQESFAYPVLDTPPALSTQAASNTPTTSPASAPATARFLRVSGVICGVLGLGSVGAGVYYWRRATSLSESANKATIYKQDDYDQGKRAQTMQWIFYSVGAAAVTTGAILYFFGSRSPEKREASVSLTPVMGPGSAGVLARGAF